MTKESSKYEPKVDPRKCIGCDLCARILPGVFTMRDHRGIAIVHDNEGWKPDKESELLSSEKNCPVNAISVTPSDSP